MQEENKLTRCLSDSSFQELDTRCLRFELSKKANAKLEFSSKR